MIDPTRIFQTKIFCKQNLHFNHHPLAALTKNVFNNIFTKMCNYYNVRIIPGNVKYTSTFHMKTMFYIDNITRIILEIITQNHLNDNQYHLFYIWQFWPPPCCEVDELVSRDRRPVIADKKYDFGNAGKLIGITFHLIQVYSLYKYDCILLAVDAKENRKTDIHFMSSVRSIKNDLSGQETKLDYSIHDTVVLFVHAHEYPYGDK